MRRVGLYPGSFDPLTNGHLDMLRAAFRLFDHVVVAIGVHPSKTPLFPADQRERMVMEAAGPLAAAAGATLEVRQFGNLVTAFAVEVGATALIRGLRDGTDLDYEMQMSGMNGVIAPALQTVFFPASPQTATSPPRWCGRWRRWAATYRLSFRRTSRPPSRPGSPSLSDLPAAQQGPRRCSSASQPLSPP